MSRLRWMSAILILAGALVIAVQGAQATGRTQGVSNDTCLACHGRPGINLTLDNGEVVPLFVDGSVFAMSVHGQQDFDCVQCHTTLGNYPHPTFHAADRRDFSTQLYRACQSCHQNEYEKTLDSVHERARAAGVPEAALCTDCHGAHDTTPPDGSTDARAARRRPDLDPPDLRQVPQRHLRQVPHQRAWFGLDRRRQHGCPDVYRLPWCAQHR